MAFQLTSQAPCARTANDGDIEMGGVVANGCGRKLKQGQGDTWINGVICDGNCNYGEIGDSTTPNLCERDHAEPDWISKEIAFQEFFCNDVGLFKDQHNMNVVSAFTAVAAMLRDWCNAEKDLSALIVNGHVHCLGLSSDHPMDSDMDLREEVELLASLLTQDDVCSDKFLKEHCNNIVMPHHSLQQSGLFENRDASEPVQVVFKGVEISESNLHACQRTDTSTSGTEKQRENFGPLLQCSWRPAEWKIKSRPDEAREHIAPTESDLNNGFEPFAGLNMHALFGKQISPASRFSFGRKVGMSPEMDSTTLSRALEESEVMTCSAGSSFRVVDVCKGTGFGGEYKGVEGEQMGEDLVPEGFVYALSYMSLQNLLNMEQVCKSLRNRIKNDVLLWQRLHIELPMSNSLTDDIFLELASRARGQLQSLSLVDCTRVTEVALERVVLSNPRLSKLSLPGCSRISADGVVRMVERLTHHNSFSGSLSSLKQLRVRNMDGFTKEHLERLQMMVGMRMQDRTSVQKSQFYHLKHHNSFHDDNRAIDVEECPKCSNVRLVFDCTREKCRGNEGFAFQDCRACILCIVRCEACGGCITDNDYEETFSLDVLCSRCWFGLAKCAECNRPACGSHADHFIRTPETTFVCGECCGTSPEINGSEFRVCA